MKTLIAALSLLLISLTTSGQQSFASLSFGASIPLDTYAETGDLTGNGYANSGAAIKFDAAYFPVLYVGIAGSFSFGTNYAIRDSLLADMIMYIEDNSQTISGIPGYAEISYGSGTWNYISLLIGPHFSARPARRIYLDLRAMTGLTIVRPPDREMLITFDATQILSPPGDSNLALGLTAGAGLRFKLNADIALKIAADYFLSRADFEYKFEMFGDPVEEIQPVVAEYKLKTVELSIGLAYSF